MRGTVGRFLGNYLYQVDEKGRVSLPAPFRRGAESPSFVLIRVHPDALTLYPVEAWARVQDELRELLKRNPEARHYVLGITSNAREVTPDKQGRILLPDRHRKGVGIGHQALIVGAMDKIEIWEPERFGETVGGEASSFDDLASSIFA
ncbi:MAG: division/cell wall cluster transcriptional repressor MraZ [Gemmatimonadota bacterium]